MTLIRRAIFVLVGCLSAMPSLAQDVTAVLEPTRSVELRSTVNGRVNSIVQSEGTLVTKDSIVAEIDGSVQRARLNLAQVTAEALGNLDRAEQLVTQATFRRDRIAAAKDKGAAQAWEVELAEQALAVALADLQVARDERARRAAELDLERATLAEFSVRAPFDATVLDVVVDEGEIVDTATVLVELGALDALEATAFLPVDWANALRDGARLNTRVESGGALKAAVKSIDPRIDPASRTVRVIISVENDGNALRPGEILVVENPG